MSAWNNAEGGIVDSFDPGTPDARRAWLDSLPVGTVVVDGRGWEQRRTSHGWSVFGDPDDVVLDDGEISAWCALDSWWPATVPAAVVPPVPFACPADWTPPQPAEVRAMLAKAGLSQVEAARSLGMSRSAVAKWLSGESRIGWPAWRLLLEMAHGRD